MSNLNIKRAVENIRSGTNVYTPITEVVVNAIQAIEECDSENGVVEIRANRSAQMELDEPLPEISGFTIIDNGIGFTDSHRESFDTLYTEHKLSEGGKGFGRFTCLKYYEDVDYISCYKQGDTFFERSFSMGKEKEIIVNEKVVEKRSGNTGTRVELKSTTKTFPEKNLNLIARRLVEKLLPYFISEKSCPKVVLSEAKGENPITLNDYIGEDKDSLIIESKKSNGKFKFEGKDCEYDFSVRTFKIYSPSDLSPRLTPQLR